MCSRFLTFIPTCHTCCLSWRGVRIPTGHGNTAQRAIWGCASVLLGVGCVVICQGALVRGGLALGLFLLRPNLGLPIIGLACIWLLLRKRWVRWVA